MFKSRCLLLAGKAEDGLRQSEKTVRIHIHVHEAATWKCATIDSLVSWHFTSTPNFVWKRIYILKTTNVATSDIVTEK